MNGPGDAAGTDQTGPKALRPPWGVLAGHAVALTAGVLIALVLFDAVRRPPLQTITAVALGALAMLLALRVSQLLRAARQQTDVRRELAQSRALIELSRALAGSTNLNHTLETVTHLTRRSLGTQTTGILMLMEGGQAVELKAEVGAFARSGLRFPLEGSLTASALLSAEPRSTTAPQRTTRTSPDERTLAGTLPFAVAPLLCRGDAQGALYCVRAQPFTAAELELLAAMADHAALAIENAQLFEQVHALSITDPLTGLSNRRQLERDVGREFAAARRGRRLVAVMFDLDDFKDYNDRFGHLQGDQALRAFAGILAEETRAMNLAARYGGDEFVVLLADTDYLGAQVFVSRVQQLFQRVAEQLADNKLSVCAGIAEYSPDMADPSHVLAAADLALYASKGRRART